jgi:thiol-disulfide isomerase/thioredoxin
MDTLGYSTINFRRKAVVRGVDMAKARVQWRLAAILVAMLLVTNSQVALAQELPKNVVLHDQPKAVAAINFSDVQGGSRALADWRGKVILLNIWATWCVPCRSEMPVLDRLQIALGGPDFEVVPLSIDRGGIDSVLKFYAEIGIRNLGIYVDKSGNTVRQLRGVGLPMTLLVDRGGYEFARIIGAAEWDTPQIAELLRAKF